MKLLTSGNDKKIRIFNLEKEDYSEPESTFVNDCPVNVAKFNRDHSLLAIYGDCYPAQILDPKSGKMLDPLYGHDDYGFSISWHPSGVYLATGN